MKYVVTKQDGQSGEEEIFLFPRNIEFDVIAPLLGMIKNANYGNWFRVKRSPVSFGTFSANGFNSIIERDQLHQYPLGVISDLFNKQLAVDCKYITVSLYDDENNKQYELYAFPKVVHHDCFYEIINSQDQYREMVSAGFVNSDLVCYGASETLAVESREEDTELLKNQMSK